MCSQIHEPKERVVAAAPFRDRVVHHALVRVLEPIFDKRFIEDSFASQNGKGTHAGMRYFPSIDHEILLSAIDKVIADPRVLDLVRLILASHRDGLREEWPEGDLFSLVESHTACPLGT